MPQSTGGFMRTGSVAFGSIGVLLAVLSSEGGLFAQTTIGGLRLLERPDAFQTLVNPSCSHCVDEAKRRGDQLRKDDRVLAWIRGKYDGGAIPVRFFLSTYRVISDTYGVFVYDPDAGFLRGFEPSLDFRFHGWRNGVMVMRHKDGTLYSTLSGKAFDGPRKGDQLKPIPTIETAWGDWLNRYPGTVAYQMFDNYQPVGPRPTDNADSIATRIANDERLPAMSEVLGVVLDGEARAYPLAALEKSGGVTADTLAGQKLLILWYPPTRTAAVYSAELDDATPARPVTLMGDSSQTSTPFIDRETGSHWDIAGRAISGELKSKTLRWLPGIQCRWFAWAAEYPQTAIYKSSDAPSDRQQGLAKPIEGVIVAAADVTKDKVAGWSASGTSAVVIVLDEDTTAAAYQAAATVIAQAKLDLYYWIEVARNKRLADAHPRWMASLGMHHDWHERFPNTPVPTKDREVAKAYPWVPIGYRESFDAHLVRIKDLMKRATGGYRGILLNDLQGGPASCGCGNLQCRWALDYRVSATATPIAGDDVANQFLAEVRKMVPGKEVVPIWMTECEDIDLSAKLRAGAPTTGLCGSVPCAANTCPTVFTQQWSSLVSDGRAVGVLALQAELERSRSPYSPASWVPKAVEYLDTIPAKHGGKSLPHNRLWIVIQGYGVSALEQAAARSAALQVNPAAVLVALTRLDQSYEPRLVPVQ
jgi:hypothetical protein